MKNCDKCHSLQKKLKILQAETSFEIKKLEQDTAHQKVTLQLAHQKQIQRLTDRLNAQRQDREKENKSWIEKYDSMVKVYDQKFQQKERECREKIREMELELEKKQELTKSQKESKIREQIQTMRGESEQYKKRLIQVKQEEKKLIEKFHQEQLQRNNVKFQKEKEYIETQKQQLIEQIKELEKKDLMNKTIQIQLSEELYYKKEEINNLNEKVEQLESTVKLCYGELHTKERVLEYVRKQYNERLKKIQKDFQKQKEELINKNKKQIESILEKELHKIQNYEAKISELQEKRQAQIKMYEANFKQVKALVDENRCPPKFSNEINHLKYKLNSKEKEIQRAKADIKLYQLEMENNDEILTKFFMTPTTSTVPELTHKRSNKQFKIKHNRGSIAGSLTASNWRSPSVNKDRPHHDHDNSYNEYHTTSLQNLDNSLLNSRTKVVKLL